MTNIDESDKGRRVELILCDDPHTKMEPGMKGTYQMCFRQLNALENQYCIDWDNGSKLMLIAGVDEFRFLD